MLFEMLRGGPIADGWHSTEVRDALDLCLACKGCKSDCPANVDMATYKAEFLSHYYERHLRPRTAHTLGLIFRWARIAAHAPALANFFTQTPGLRAFAKAVAGIAPRRRVPTFAPETFVAWFRRRLVPGGAQSSPRVVLWPDTFNNYFRSGIARAAVEVLEAAGFEVVVPTRSVCCGRPLYDYGRLDLAKRMLRDTIAVLRPHLAAGVPVVGLEPSCIAVFRDELVNLFPDDEDARRLSQQSFLFGEFLERHARDFELPRSPGQALVHFHCHQKSLMGTADDLAVLKRLGLDCSSPEPGCCGMAGAFGFEREHYDVSMQIGERTLLPAVRKAEADALIIADGFSCREQIDQGTGRRPLHLAEVVRLAMSARKRT